ncbi:MAG: hypothetical protein Q7T11_02610 [Deltaproteobacteria bacterium]|nr:hypothetical protein [Deltaproteobacteria bacterium]
MFEFEDSKLGRIKVISVTEARTSFATIMTDKSFNYVITKNNRPIRVIINYDTYRTQLAPFSAGKMGTAAKPGKGQLKGLIETREKELKDVVSRMVESQAIPEEIKQAVGMETPMLEPESESVPELEPEPQPEPDYFGANATPEQTDYFARFRKLYESPKTSPPPPARVRPPEPPPVRARVPVPEAPPPEVDAQPKKEPEKRERRAEPPSIQDLLLELENTKLSGEE